MSVELTPEQIAAQNKAEAYVRSQLDSTEPTTLSVFKKDALTKYEASLVANDEKYKNDPEALKQKMEAAGAEIDAQLVANARDGAIKDNPNISAFREEDPGKAQAREGAMGLIDMVLGWIGSFFGGLGGLFMNVLKMIPGVGDFIQDSADNLADKTLGISAEQKANDTLAAGVAESLQRPIDIGTETFALAPDKSGKVFRDFTRHLEGSNLEAAQRAAAAGARPEGVAPQDFHGANGVVPEGGVPTGGPAPAPASGVGAAPAH